MNLDLGKERHRPVPVPKKKTTPDQKAGEQSGKRTQKLAGKRLSQAEGLTAPQKKELDRAKALAAIRLKEKLKLEQEIAGMQQQESAVSVDDKTLEELVRAKAEAERLKKLEHSAKLISNALGREIKAGSVDVETAGEKIIIRVREKASFGSGRAELKESFRPILAKVAKILEGSEGKIIVAGHTDNIPIHTERFRSNWELSSARAVSVAHEMMRATDIPSNRFLIQGFADTEPMVPNDTPANRAKNRRVEIILQQGEDREGKQIGVVDGQGASLKSPGRRGRALPAAPARPQTKAPAAPAKKPLAAVKPTSPAAVPGVKQVSRPAEKPVASAPGKTGVVKGVRAGGTKKPAPAGNEKKISKPSSGLGIKLGGSK